jgi:uncharacterized protein YneF (UPF0154 family)
MEQALGFIIFVAICAFIFRKQIKEYLANK